MAVAATLEKFASVPEQFYESRVFRPVCTKQGESMMFLDDKDMTALNSGIITAERGISQQEKIVAELRRLGEPTHLAEKFLVRLRDTLEMHRQHRDKLMASKAEALQPVL